MYIYQTKIHLHETDAAGLLFFGEQFKLMHDAYESLSETIGYSFAALIRERDFFLPIVHAEADYKKPLFVGELLEIQVILHKIGQTSFQFKYKLLDTKQNLVGSGRTVHVTMDKKTKTKIPLPKELREKVQGLYDEDHK